MAPIANLKTMSIDKLFKLRSEVETILESKVADERHSLEMRLSELSRVTSQGPRAKGRRAIGKVAPKYRNPENPAETWAGRGLKPRWLTAALKAGKKLEYFSITPGRKKAVKQTRRRKIKVSEKVPAKSTRSPRQRPAPPSNASPGPAGAAQT